jgi:hypothetical protein
VSRLFDDSARWAPFHDSSIEHYSREVAGVFGNGKVVSNEHIRHSKLSLQVSKQVQDL